MKARVMASFLRYSMWQKNQRVISRTEPELGLGTIISVATTKILVQFTKTNEKRVYNTKVNVPIQRLRLEVGDKAWMDNEHYFIIAKVYEKDFLLLYENEAGDQIWEWELSDHVEDAGILEQFYGLQFTHHRAFNLRMEAWKIRSSSRSSIVRGFVGPRVEPLAHQLYVAKSVTKQNNPRVLLADEVGLGKTIESGLIFSSMRALNRANKVLIIVPESLIHQWLAEMFRRFNELFSVLDEDRCFEEEQSQQKSAFEINQKIICSEEFFLKNPTRINQACAQEWDLLIIDEAHHLKYTKDSDELTNWHVVKSISAQARGLLLLTATPRLYGVESLFALLQLLDPQRFTDLESFLDEAKHMKDVAEIARELQNKGYTETSLKGHADALKKLFPKDNSLHELLAENPLSVPKLIRALVDRHGTGRVFFRNRRERLQGFPKRKLFSIPVSDADEERIHWLVDFLQKDPLDKVLLLCRSKRQVNKIAKDLQAANFEQFAIFHEGLSIVERDVQAAKFADSKKSQILLCSEIGGEGRNFQFCHKIVLFDMPRHPDLVEQRIGRLDRIGQKNTIEIYSLWQKDTVDEVLFHWYHDALNAFESFWNGAGTIYEQFSDQIQSIKAEDKEAIQSLVTDTKIAVTKLKEQNANSVDVLVDLNSFNEKVGSDLQEKVEDCDDDISLELFIKAALDHYGVSYKEIDQQGTLYVKGDSLEFIDNFPGISSEDGTVFAFDRSAALAREDYTFISQDHTIAEEILSLLLDRNEGLASICKWENSPHRSGALIDLAFILDASGPLQLELNRYLPLDTLQLTFDYEGKQIVKSEHLENPELLQEINVHNVPLDRERLEAIIEPLVEKATKSAKDWSESKIKAALALAKKNLMEEESRLIYLASINPNFTQTELKEFQSNAQKIMALLQNTKVRLDAIRMVFTS